MKIHTRSKKKFDSCQVTPGGPWKGFSCYQIPLINLYGMVLSRFRLKVEQTSNCTGGARLVIGLCVLMPITFVILAARGPGHQPIRSRPPGVREFQPADDPVEKMLRPGVIDKINFRLVSSFDSRNLVTSVRQR